MNKSVWEAFKEIRQGNVVRFSGRDSKFDDMNLCACESRGVWYLEVRHHGQYAYKLSFKALEECLRDHPQVNPEKWEVVPTMFS